MKVNIGTSDTAFKQMDIRKKTKTQKACYTNIRIGKHTICMGNFFSQGCMIRCNSLHWPPGGNICTFQNSTP